MNAQLSDTLWASTAELLTAHVEQSGLSRPLKDAVLKHLSGPKRVLPDGKATACASLTLLSFAATSQSDPRTAIPAAAAMEMLVAAGDIIDDLQDNVDGYENDRHRVGEAFEVTSLLLLFAHELINAMSDQGLEAQRVLRALRRLDRVMARSMSGQDADMRVEASNSAQPDDSLRITQQKSANMVKFAGELGAILGTDQIDQIALCGHFGWHLGTVAQLSNDIGGVWPGGPPSSDIQLGKRTVPITFALHTTPGMSSQNAQRNVLGISKDEERTRRLIWMSGGIHYAWWLAAVSKARAIRTAERLSIHRPGRYHLASILN